MQANIERDTRRWKPAYTPPINSNHGFTDEDM
jgi:hypothetical protein